jgi:hypothetical protein
VVSTKISNEGSSKAGDASKIHVSGMLPRLSFNLTCSAIRLVAKLQERWRSRKRETENFTIYTAAAASGLPDGAAKHLNNIAATINSKNQTKTEQNAARIFIFEFSAPLITLKLENDTSASENRRIVPLFDLAIGGFSGRIPNQSFCQSGSMSCMWNRIRKRSLQYAGPYPFLSKQKP